MGDHDIGGFDCFGGEDLRLLGGDVDALLRPSRRRELG
jgi:hypothetical protein